MQVRARALRPVGTLLLPIAAYFGLTAIGIVTGYITLCNLCEFALIGWVLACSFVRLFQRKILSSLMELSSAGAIVYFIYVGFTFNSEDIRAYIYDLQIATVPGFVASCLPAEGIAIRGDFLRVCKELDFNDHNFDDAIVRITGPAPARDVLADVDAGAVSFEATRDLRRFGGIWPHICVRKLLQNYYLVANRDE